MSDAKIRHIHSCQWRSRKRVYKRLHLDSAHRPAVGEEFAFFLLNEFPFFLPNEYVPFPLNKFVPFPLNNDQGAIACSQATLAGMDHHTLNDLLRFRKRTRPCEDHEYDHP